MTRESRDKRLLIADKPEIFQVLRCGLFCVRRKLLGKLETLASPRLHPEDVFIHVEAMFSLS